MSRTRPDSCPGAVHLHQAADGPLARIRLPGGLLSSEQLLVLAESARELGDGAIGLTSRGNAQLRAVRDPGALADRLAAAGLLPSSSHERVRNIVASPLSGRIGGIVDIRPFVAALDAGILARPGLAELPGRVLFTLDDGRGDVSRLGGDIGLHAVGPEQFALVLAGADSHARLAATDAVEQLLAAASAFAGLRTDEWRLAEIVDGRQRILAELGLPTTQSADAVAETAAIEPPIGWFDQPNGSVTLVAGIALGSLDARTAEFLAAVGRPLIVTPWRSIVLGDLDEHTAEQIVRVLAPMGLIFDAQSPWLPVTACVGRPGCAGSHADVRADVAAAIAGGRLPVVGRQHWSGCERRCGRPPALAADVVATEDGYRVQTSTGAVGVTAESDAAPR